MSDEDILVAAAVAIGGFFLANPLAAGAAVASVAAPLAARENAENWESLGVPEAIADPLGWLTVPLPLNPFVLKDWLIGVLT